MCVKQKYSIRPGSTEHLVYFTLIKKNVLVKERKNSFKCSYKILMHLPLS